MHSLGKTSLYGSLSKGERLVCSSELYQSEAVPRDPLQTNVPKSFAMSPAEQLAKSMAVMKVWPRPSLQLEISVEPASEVSPQLSWYEPVGG